MLESTLTGDGSLEVRLAGSVTLAEKPSLEPVRAQLASGRVRHVRFVADRLERWDSALLVAVRAVLAECAERGIDVERDALPNGIVRLLALAEAVPAQAAKPQAKHEGLLARVGVRTLAIGAGFGDFVRFVGELTIATGRMLAGKAGFRRADLLLFVQQTGAEALPIVSLISAIVGTILAFVGAVQLARFGAGIFVADLVAIAMSREMSCLMTGIILAGRTGAAFAAQLGTMKVTEEIDAMTTFGFAPMQFLVLPRVLALALMMPLLCLYSDLVGLVGGAVVGVTMLDLSPRLYVQSTLHALTLANVALGVGKSVVFGVLVALFGCYRGIRCGSSASAVGDAATAAVVSGIVAIVVADGLFAVVTSLLGV